MTCGEDVQKSTKFKDKEYVYVLKCLHMTFLVLFLSKKPLLFWLPPQEKRRHANILSKASRPTSRR